MKKYKIGYTQGTFDLFHVGHLNLLRHAKELCDVLIVGVNKDKLVKDYKGIKPIIPEKDRKEIIDSIKYVDSTILCDTLDKKKILDKINFDVVFIGDDWKNNERWIQTEKELNVLGIDVIFLQYTKGISSTILRKEVKNEKN